MFTNNRVSRWFPSVGIGFATLFVFPHAIHSQDLGRNVASGNWNTGSEWVNSAGVTGSAPTGSSNVYIGSFGYPHVTSVGTSQVSLNSAGVANSVFVGDGAGGNGALTLQPGGSLAAVDFNLGLNGGTGLLDLAGQQITLSGNFNHGAGASVMHSGGGITANSFFMLGVSSFSMEGTDSFADSVSVSGGATMTTSVALNLTAGLRGLSVIGSGTSFTSGNTVSVRSINVTNDAMFTANGAVTALDAIYVRNNATFNTNANVTAGQFYLGAATLNLNGNTLSAGYLDLGKTYGGPTTINRGGGNFSATDFALGSGTNFTYEVGDNFTNRGDLYGGSTLKTVQAMNLTGSLWVDSSTLDLDGQLLTLGDRFRFGNGSTLIRGAGGAIHASGFDIYGGNSYAYDGTDTFTDYVVVSSGATMTTSVALNLNLGLNVGGLGTSFTSGNTVSVNSIDVNNDAVFTANGAVTVSAPIIVRNNATFNMNANVAADQFYLGAATLNLNGNTLTVDFLDLGSIYGGPGTVNRGGGNFSATAFFLGNGTSFTYEVGDNFSNSGNLSSGSTLTLNQDLTLAFSLNATGDSTINLGNHTLNVGSLDLGDPTTVTRSVGSLIIAGDLNVFGETDLFSLAGDELSNSLRLGFNQPGFITMTQMAGDTTGLSLLNSSLSALQIDSATASLLKLAFDGGQSMGVLDWGFRWSGDHIIDLNALLGSKIIVSGAPQSVSVIRNLGLYGDFTYIGFVGVPEPNSLAMLVVAWGVFTLGARRKTTRVAGDCV